MRLVFQVLMSGGIGLLSGSLWQPAFSQTSPLPTNIQTIEIPEADLEQTLPSTEENVPAEPLTDDTDVTIPVPSDILLPVGETCFQEETRNELRSSEENSFIVKQIKITGELTVLQDEISDLVERFLFEASSSMMPLETFAGRQTTLAELLDLRSCIQALYISEGYITSGAFLPNHQEVQDGIVEIQVVEGSIEEIQINGLKRLKDYYVRDRITPATSSPVNVSQLEERLRLLQIDPLIDTIDAEITAGRESGQNILVLDVAESPALVVNLALSNTRAPSVGSVQGSPTIVYRNVLGFGDRASAQYSRSEGLNLYSVGYAVPINALDGSLSARYELGESRIITPQFEEADIRSETETISVNFRQPVSRSLSSEFALGVGFDVREGRSFILDNRPFSFSRGPEDGVSRVSVIRFSQEWLSRDVDTVLAARSQFSFGIDAFGSTINDSGTDGRFVAWTGQFQLVQQFNPGERLLTRVNTQLTPDSLLPLERFSLGGVSTVRGYAQNELVTDNGVAVSVEYQRPLLREPEKLKLVPFVDFGAGWNSGTRYAELST